MVLGGDGNKTGDSNTGSGSLDWKNQEDHPMVKDPKSTGDGSLDWKKQEDHPMVKDPTSTGDGSLDWRKQEDHPMVKDPDQGKKEEEPLNFQKLWDDLFGYDSASAV